MHHERRDIAESRRRSDAGDAMKDSLRRVLAKRAPERSVRAGTLVNRVLNVPEARVSRQVGARSVCRNMVNGQSAAAISCWLVALRPTRSARSQAAATRRAISGKADAAGFRNASTATLIGGVQHGRQARRPVRSASIATFSAGKRARSGSAKVRGADRREVEATGARRRPDREKRGNGRPERAHVGRQPCRPSSRRRRR